MERKEVFQRYIESYGIKNIELAKKRFDSDIKNIIKKNAIRQLDRYSKKFKNNVTVSFASVVNEGIDIRELLTVLDEIRDMAGYSLYSETAGLNSIRVSGKDAKKFVEEYVLNIFCKENEI